MAHLNQNGVLTGGRKIVLARGKRFLVIATLCDFRGQWFIEATESKSTTPA